MHPGVEIISNRSMISKMIPVRVWSHPGFPSKGLVCPWDLMQGSSCGETHFA